jgi:Peptidase C39 family
VRIARIAWITLVAACGCSRGGDHAAATAAASGDAPAASAIPSAASDGAPRPVPEVRDAGPGRATAALRALLTAYGLPFDEPEVARACKVGADGASIDDLEEAAQKFGLDATQTLLPPEHVLAPGAKVLPAIAVLEGARGARDFVVLWRLDGAKVEVMDPRAGRALRPRAEVLGRLHVLEMPVATELFRDAVRSEPFRAALADRMDGLGVARASAAALLGRAAAGDGVRGLAALDASLRKLEGDPPKDGAGASALEASFACAVERKCASPDDAPAERFWSARALATGKAEGAETRVRGTVVIAVAGLAKP